MFYINSIIFINQSGVVPAVCCRIFKIRVDIQSNIIYLNSRGSKRVFLLKLSKDIKYFTQYVQRSSYANIRCSGRFGDQRARGFWVGGCGDERVKSV